jgi:serine protease Do
MVFRRATFASLFVSASVLLAACGGSSSSDSDPTVKPSDSVVASTPVSSEAGSTADTKAAGGDAGGVGKATGAVTELAGVKGAVVQILVEGEIRDMEDGPKGFSGSGSGFLIDAEGTIVTNNHVVTGAGAITVRVGGDKETAIPAKVLGVSECSDLAVIKLSAPGPYPYLTWSTQPIVPPLEIYAAGFPLGNPEYTVTRGVVSKAKAGGDTSWASVVHVIEHDANIQPGNSGGALIDTKGNVVGVNYAGGDLGQTGTSQFFAIANDLAKPVVTALRAGDQESIGVNGRAFVSEDQKLQGIFVRGVAPGGPASRAGVKPGDVMTTMNGVDLGGGTFAQYCKVLRSARDNAPISLRVVRFDSKEVLEGELNGKPLVAVFSFAEQLKEEVPAAAAGGGGGQQAPSAEYVRIKDDTGRLSVEVPANWTDTRTAPQDLLGIDTQQPTVIAAPSYADFDGGDGPGEALILVDLEGVGNIDKDTLLDAVEKSLACETGNRDNFSDDRFTGRYLAAKCKQVLVVVAVVSKPANPDQAVIMIARASTDADLAAIDRMLSSFEAS